MLLDCAISLAWGSGVGAQGHAVEDSYCHVGLFNRDCSQVLMSKVQYP